VGKIRFILLHSPRFRFRIEQLTIRKDASYRLEECAVLVPMPGRPVCVICVTPHLLIYGIYLVTEEL
jgi:hypothetical protein